MSFEQAVKLLQLGYRVVAGPDSGSPEKWIWNLGGYSTNNKQNNLSVGTGTGTPNEHQLWAITNSNPCYATQERP